MGSLARAPRSFRRTLNPRAITQTLPPLPPDPSAGKELEHTPARPHSGERGLEPGSDLTALRQSADDAATPPAKGRPATVCPHRRVLQLSGNELCRWGRISG